MPAEVKEKPASKPEIRPGVPDPSVKKKKEA
jgi:hypothetical protein